MRCRVAGALLVVIACATPASASELFGFPHSDARADQIVVYDYEPGVVTRDYWLLPWRDHHYFPWTGKRPKIGHLEHAGAHRALKQAQTFHREWSNQPAILSEAPTKQNSATPSTK
jgi:hypothetical protein